jgi:glycogen debranching enzyme
MSTSLPPSEAEWLEPDRLGGFASGTVSGVRTRRYHGLLVPATIPPAGRTVLVNGFEDLAPCSREYSGRQSRSTGTVSSAIA